MRLIAVTCLALALAACTPDAPGTAPEEPGPDCQDHPCLAPGR